MALYERIRNLREDKDLRQIDIANYLYITQTSYSRYEMGIHSIPIEVFIKLAEFYDVSIDYLVGETDVKSRYPEKKTKNAEKLLTKRISCDMIIKPHV